MFAVMHVNTYALDSTPTGLIFMGISIALVRMKQDNIEELFISVLSSTKDFSSFVPRPSAHLP